MKVPFQKITVPVIYPSKFGMDDVVRHQKGGLYSIVMLPSILIIEETGEPAYAYKSHRDSRVWVRSQRKMEDGRFQLVKRAWDLDAERKKREQAFDLLLLLGVILSIILFGIYWKLW